jgi:hypothetical protein
MGEDTDRTKAEGSDEGRSKEDRHKHRAWQTHNGTGKHGTSTQQGTLS